MQNYITYRNTVCQKVKKVLQQSQAAEQSSVWCAVCGGELGWAGLGWAVDMWAAGDIIVTRCVPTLLYSHQPSLVLQHPHHKQDILQSVSSTQLDNISRLTRVHRTTFMFAKYAAFG